MSQKFAAKVLTFYEMGNTRFTEYLRSKYNGLSRTCRHLHHHAAVRLKCLIDLLANLYLIVSQHIVVKKVCHAPAGTTQCQF